jgi:hypothetical protein
MKNLDDYTTFGAFVLVLLIMTAILWWWIPQKWQAGQRLYDNKPAQVFCVLSSN